MLKIYGSPRSSAGRCYLVMEEIGLKYETAPLDMGNKEHKSPAFLQLNPNGKVPCLVDEDFVIWESLAINHYLAERYKPELLGAGAKEKGLVQQWSVWALAELQPPLVDILIQMMFVPEDRRDQNVIRKAQEKLPANLKVLDQALSGRTYLVGSHVTLADLNTASVINIAQALKQDIESYQNIMYWFNRMKERPSFAKFADLRKH